MRLVGLVRVSTEKQGQSGLGLEAQHAAVEAYRRGVNGTLLKTYVEVESGTHDDVESRPQLRAAVGHAKRARATLVFSRIDRLVRSTVVMAYVKKAGVRFVACDNPYANELTVVILVAVAADEARKISTRTREALAAYRAGRRVARRFHELYPDGVPAAILEARAGRLGAELPECRNLTPEASRRGWERAALAHRRHADEAYADLAEWITELRRAGKTQQAIADLLNAEGHTTRRGKAWSQSQVHRVLRRLGG